MNTKTHESLSIYGPSVAMSTVFFIPLLILKLTGVVSWSWWIITSPFWFFPALFIFYFVFYIFAIVAVYCIAKIYDVYECVMFKLTGKKF